MHNTSIRDNHKFGSVGDYLKPLLNKDCSLSVVSAYFTIYAYHQLKDELNGIEDLRFLFGEPTFIKQIDPDDKNYRSYKIEDDQLIIPTKNKLKQKKIAYECAEWLDKKAEIRSMVKPNFLHGKMYHITQKSGVENAISGSSNFTVSGLGLDGTRNIELNMVVDSDRDRKDLKKWFDAIWNDDTGLVADVKDDVLKYLTQLYNENSPDFIYFKTLFHIFENYLEDQEKGGLLNEKTGFYESEIWNSLYSFQKDGVKGAINKILRHNGCIIADSVGLGKTYEALAVIRYFELLNCRVLVICPKKLSANWTIYQSSTNSTLNPFVKDRFGYNVIYHTDMGRESGRSEANGIVLETFNWSAYDLIVIDESHNFRGNPVEKESNDGSFKKNRAKWLMDKIIKEGSKTKVLMLSATPVNNTLKDIRNQIAFITEGKDDALFESSGVKDISYTFKNAQTQFSSWADPQKNPKRNLKQLLEKLDTSFFKVLDELTIARSRKHIKSFYNISEIGKFPERLKPISVSTKIDLQDRFPTYDHLNKQILQYKLSVFSPSSYVNENMKNAYEDRARTGSLAFKQADRENYLIGMMKVNYLKRLESSIESFEISINRTILKIENLESKINHFLKSKVQNQKEPSEFYEIEEFQSNEIDESDESDEDLQELQVGKKLKFDLKDLNLSDWLNDLKKDKDALVDLHTNACAVTPERDAKLHELKEIIREKISNPLNLGNRKILLFTAFADTAQYLYDNLKPFITNELKLDAALVSGSYTHTSFGKNEFEHILTNFSPLSKNRNKNEKIIQTGEIDILIATDCISEGQNLQDCDCIINYDIHWNPVRIIQRFGRIDRLGSKNEKIQLINFWPTKDLDNYINLKERVEARMALADITATGEDNILNVEQIEELISEDLKYRNKQLKRLKEEVLDLEDMDDAVSLTDFTLDDFRIELLKYIDVNKQKIKNSPLGLYAIVPSPDNKKLSENGAKFSQKEIDIIKPGVIFCLRQKGDTDGNEVLNPLQPYFLVYIRDDGNVRLNYVNAKQILEVYRLLCQGVTTPYNQLCDMFNEETDDGEKMDKYEELLKSAVSEITRIFKKRGAQKLTSDRSALIIPKTKQMYDMENFELITWLVVR